MKHLFRSEQGTPRRRRHEVYKRISERKPDAWETCGKAAQREVAIGPVQPGSRVSKRVTDEWDRAFKFAFKLVFEYSKAGKGVPPEEQGYTIADLADAEPLPQP